MADELGGGLDGGRIDIKVVADLSDVEEGKLQREIDRRTKAVKAKLEAEIEARQVAAEAKAAARAAEREAEVRLKATIDRSQLRKDLDGISRSDVRIRFTADVDKAKLRADVDAAARDAGASVGVDADTTPARNVLSQFFSFLRSGFSSSGGSGGGGGGGAGSWVIRMAVRIDDAVLKPAQAKLQQLAVAAGAVVLKYGALAVAATAAGSGLGAMTASAAQAVGVLGLLPGVAGVAIQGLAALIVGFSGVGTALGALSQADKQSAASASSA
ncbi:hypothetical protein ACFOY2_46310, partial [Nonomuraea purpurea]